MQTVPIDQLYLYTTTYTKLQCSKHIHIIIVSENDFYSSESVKSNNVNFYTCEHFNFNVIYFTFVLTFVKLLIFLNFNIIDDFMFFGWNPF